MKSLFLILPVFILAGCSTGEGDGASRVDARLNEMARSSLSQLDGDIRVTGLHNEVQVIRDPAGIAHIYANNQEDLFFAQGFVAAQDRLWEIDVWRRYAEGRASEIVGPERFETDRLYRLMKYRGSRSEDLASYHPEAERIFASFADGVNAYIEHRGDNLPVEFKITGTWPDPWTAGSLLSPSHPARRAESPAGGSARAGRRAVGRGGSESPPHPGPLRSSRDSPGTRPGGHRRTRGCDHRCPEWGLRPDSPGSGASRV